MIRKLYLLLFSLGLCFSDVTQAQDAVFSQFYAAPLHLNPAMIGFGIKPRIVLNYRNQYPSFGNAFITTNLSYDRHIPKINSSVGMSLLADRTGGGIYNTYLLTLYYAYQLHLNENLALKAGAEVSYLNKNLDWGKVILNDMINPLTGQAVIPTTESIPPSENIHRADFGFGVVAYSDKTYIGASVKHVTQPNLDFTSVADNDNRLKMRTSLHLGHTFYVGKEKFQKSRMYLSPNLLLVNQGRFNQATLGLFAGKSILYGGLQYRHTFRNSAAFITTLGVRAGIFQFGYSYDFNLARIQTNAGAHEFSLIIDFGNTEAAKNEMKRQKGAQCPTIFRPQ